MIKHAEEPRPVKVRARRAARQTPSLAPPSSPQTALGRARAPHMAGRCVNARAPGPHGRVRGARRRARRRGSGRGSTAPRVRARSLPRGPRASARGETLLQAWSG